MDESKDSRSSLVFNLLSFWGAVVDELNFPLACEYSLLLSLPFRKTINVERPVYWISNNVYVHFHLHLKCGYLNPFPGILSLQL